MSIQTRHRGRSRGPMPAAAGLALGALLLLAGGTSHASRITCESLAGRTLAGATLGSAEVVPPTATAPEYCRVRGLILPALNFEMRLPAEWNQKMHYGGGGGYNGSIPGPNLPALNQGYAQVSSDSGHQGSGVDASFALNDPYAAQLFGSLSVPTVMGSAREIVRLYYGRPIRRAYFEGCSNGGREGLMAAQRNPTLFDGIIARAPAYNWVGIMAAFNRTAVALAAPGGAMSPAKVATLSGAVLAACDAADGIVDGVVGNAAACSFDPATLRCPGGGDDGDHCLSDAQLAVVASWTDPVELDGGSYRNPGWPLTGNESVPGAWGNWVTGIGGGPSLQFLFQDTTVKNYLARDPAADSLTYDFESDPGALFALEALNSATNADLRPFLGAGGRLILWHGGNDPALSVTATSEYYQQMVDTVGGQSVADSFVRYYVAPGVNHCAGGPGADSADLLSALDAWVTQRRPPRTLLAVKRDPATGQTLFARPLCRFPAYPRYTGRGDPADATSYRCAIR